MRELDKSEIQEVSGGAFIDDLLGDSILGDLYSIAVDLFDFYNKWFSD